MKSHSGRKTGIILIATIIIFIIFLRLGLKSITQIGSNWVFTNPAINASISVNVNNQSTIIKGHPNNSDINLAQQVVFYLYFASQSQINNFRTQYGVNPSAYYINLLNAHGYGASSPAQNTTTMTPPPSNSPPPISINSFLILLTSSINNFLTAISSNFSNWFAIPKGLFSITAGPVSAQNVTYIGNTLTVNISIAIPQALQSNKWTVGNSIIQNTECLSYTYLNTTGQFVYQSPLFNATTNFYNNTFSFTPGSSGVYVFGASCQSSNKTFSNLVWSGWSSPSITINEYAPRSAISRNVALVPPPQTTVNISNSSLLAQVGNIFAQLATFFAGLFRALGLTH